MSATIEAEETSVQGMRNDELARIVEERVSGCFTKIRDALPFIVELRARFASRPRGSANIAGCQTWKEFCEKRLRRSDRRIRQLIEACEEEPSRPPRVRQKKEPDVLGKLRAVMNAVHGLPPDRSLASVIRRLREFADQLEMLQQKRAGERQAEADRILAS